MVLIDNVGSTSIQNEIQPALKELLFCSYGVFLLSGNRFILCTDCLHKHSEEEIKINRHLQRLVKRLTGNSHFALRMTLHTWTCFVRFFVYLECETGVGTER